MIIWGINAQNHDASITIFDSNENKILFAGHAERYSRIKNDSHLNKELIDDAMRYCDGKIDQIVWYENPLYKKLRYLKAGQWNRFFSEMSPKKYLDHFGLKKKEILIGDHHRSHAAGSYFTSGFKDAAIIVVDAIGEFSTTSVYHGIDSSLTKILNQNYPNSIGLFYSAITQLVGLKPNEEEYILMGMAAYGNPTVYKNRLIDTFIKQTDDHIFEVKHNMHKGVSHFFEEDFNERDEMDLAAAAQEIVEEYLIRLCTWAKNKTKSKNLVLSGGVALNCVANSKIAKECGFENIWILPNPGDAGNSLGAILSFTNKHTEFQTPYLGYDIQQDLNIDSCVDLLINGNIIGVANGRAEFGPRAFGNRSLFGDPRIENSKQRMNNIKQRQQFRPFAPIVLEDMAQDFFEMPFKTSPFMQFTVNVKNPNLLPGISHIDNSARVQTISHNQNPKIYNLLLRFYEKTGCPVLMNTSLNIKGEPLVNTWEDAIRFKQKYSIEIF